MIEAKLIFEKYEMQRLIGQGSFGTVYYGKHIVTNKEVAIKVMKKAEVEEAGMTDQIKREISIMGRVKHPNIVEIKEVMATKTKIYLVMEYLEGGDLCFRIVRRGKLNEKDAIRYFQQLIGAVDFCHRQGVYHRDLKLENLLLDETKQNLKVADFGLSATADQFHRDGLLHTVCGAPAYMAPEVMQGRGYDGAKFDIWSCGVILFALLSGTLPFQDENLKRMSEKIIAAKYEFHPGFPVGAKKLVAKMLVKDPAQRISIEAIKRDPWFLRGINRSISTATLSEMGGRLSPGNSGRFGSPRAGMSNLGRTTTMPAGFSNAFELISSMASGFNLSNLFEEQRETVFTSKRAAEAVVEEIERMARGMKFGVERVEELKVKLVAPEDGRRLIVTVEAMRTTSELTTVEMWKTEGDTAEFVRFCEEEARPALGDLVSTWQAC